MKLAVLCSAALVCFAALTEAKEFCGYPCGFWHGENRIPFSKKEKAACNCKRIKYCISHIAAGKPSNKELFLFDNSGIFGSLKNGDDGGCPAGDAELEKGEDYLETAFFKQCWTVPDLTSYQGPGVAEEMENQMQKDTELCNRILARAEEIHNGAGRPNGFSKKLLAAAKWAYTTSERNREGRRSEIAKEKAREDASKKQQQARKEQQVWDDRRREEEMGEIEQTLTDEAIAPLKSATTLCEVTCLSDDKHVSMLNKAKAFLIDEEEDSEAGGTCACRRVANCGRLMQNSWEFKKWVPEFRASLVLKRDGLKCSEEKEQDGRYMKQLKGAVVGLMSSRDEDVKMYGNIAREIIQEALMTGDAMEHDMFTQMAVDVTKSYAQLLAQEEEENQ